MSGGFSGAGFSDGFSIDDEDAPAVVVHGAIPSGAVSADRAIRQPSVSMSQRVNVQTSERRN